MSIVMVVAGVPTPEAARALAVATDARVSNEAAVRAARVLTRRIQRIVHVPEVFAGRLADALVHHREHPEE